MTNATLSHSNAIRHVLGQCGKLEKNVADLDDNEDLYDAGLSSHASVAVMLGLEEQLEVEFPDQLLRKSTFASIRNINEVLEQLRRENQQ